MEEVLTHWRSREPSSAEGIATSKIAAESKRKTSEIKLVEFGQTDKCLLHAPEF